MAKTDQLEKFIGEECHHEFGMALPCWSWAGRIDEKNRPRIKLGGRNLFAKRAYFKMMGVKLTKQDHVIQLCQNKLCVRPEHLVVGTAEDGRFGAYNPNDILGMRFLYERGEVTFEHIALSYGVNQNIVEAAMKEGDGYTAEEIMNLLIK